MYFYYKYYSEHKYLPKLGAEEHLSNCDLLLIKFAHDSVISFNVSVLEFLVSLFFLDTIWRGKLQ